MARKRAKYSSFGSSKSHQVCKYCHRPISEKISLRKHMRYCTGSFTQNNFNLIHPMANSMEVNFSNPSNVNLDITNLASNLPTQNSSEDACDDFLKNIIQRTHPNIEKQTNEDLSINNNNNVEMKSVDGNESLSTSNEIVLNDEGSNHSYGNSSDLLDTPKASVHNKNRSSLHTIIGNLIICNQISNNTTIDNQLSDIPVNIKSDQVDIHHLLGNQFKLHDDFMAYDPAVNQYEESYLRLYDFCLANGCPLEFLDNDYQLLGDTRIGTHRWLGLHILLDSTFPTDLLASSDQHPPIARESLPEFFRLQILDIYHVHQHEQNWRTQEDLSFHHNHR